MNLSLLSTLSCLFALGCGPAPVANPAPTITLASGTATLRVTVSPVVPGKGKVWCALHVDGSTFPGASPVIGGQLYAEATATSVECEWVGLPAREYAASVYQDTNSNERIDVDAFGAPIEGYGATRNQLPAASAPTFDDNKLPLADGETKVVAITLKGQR